MSGLQCLKHRDFGQLWAIACLNNVFWDDFDTDCLARDSVFADQGHAVSHVIKSKQLILLNRLGETLCSYRLLVAHLSPLVRGEVEHEL